MLHCSNIQGVHVPKKTEISLKFEKRIEERICNFIENVLTAETAEKVLLHLYFDCKKSVIFNNLLKISNTKSRISGMRKNQTNINRFYLLGM